VGVQLMIQHVKKVGMHLKIHYIKKVKIVLFAVHIAKILCMIAHAAKNVAQRHAFAATFVKTCASNANAGLQRCFRILFGEQFCIMKCNNNSVCALVQTPEFCLW
jgi:hypothetical protein